MLEELNDEQSRRAEERRGRVLSCDQPSQWSREGTPLITHSRRRRFENRTDKNARTAHPGGKKLRLEREAGEDAAELRSFK